MQRVFIEIHSKHKERMRLEWPALAGVWDHRGPVKVRTVTRQVWDEQALPGVLYCRRPADPLCTQAADVPLFYASHCLLHVSFTLTVTETDS